MGGVPAISDTESTRWLRRLVIDNDNDNYDDDDGRDGTAREIIATATNNNTSDGKFSLVEGLIDHSLRDRGPESLALLSAFALVLLRTLSELNSFSKGQGKLNDKKYSLSLLILNVHNIISCKVSYSLDIATQAITDDLY